MATEEYHGILVIVMGVSGCGKSTVGKALADALGTSSRTIPFYDGDDLHPQSNVDKMSRGEPLNDYDREPWLTLIREKALDICLEQGEQGVKEPMVVIGCSALKRQYREIIRGRHPSTIARTNVTLKTYFVFIDGPRDVLLERMTHRQGHFMKSSMLDSQLATLEPPKDEDEGGIVKVDLEASVEVQVETAKRELRERGVDVDN